MNDKFKQFLIREGFADPSEYGDVIERGETLSGRQTAIALAALQEASDEAIIDNLGGTIFNDVTPEEIQQLRDMLRR